MTLPGQQMPDRRQTDRTDAARLAVLETTYDVVTAGQQAILGSLNSIRDQITELRMDGVSRLAALSQTNTEVKALDDKLSAHLKHEDGLMQLLAQQRQPDTPQSGLGALREKAVNASIIAVCAIFLLGAVSWVNTHMLNPNTVQAEKALIGGH